MAFIDEAIITVQSGNGGRGCVSFRREKFIPKGGPNGGDGGDGGHIRIRATKRILTLADFNARKFFKAQNGQPGRGKNQSGKNGSEIVIQVPLGTIISNVETEEVIADIVEDGETHLILQGGKGGKGNQHFATSTNRVPRFAQPGLPGEQTKLKLILKCLADVGLIGLPNAGKSTLLSSLTQASPKIGAYPFTTIDPNLGVITYENEETTTVADIPGLIEGASQGRGLGHQFLKHIERTRILLHLIDITYIPRDDILEDYLVIENELERYEPSLVKKSRMVLINKMDVHAPGQREIPQLQKALDDRGIDSIPISALTGEGIDALKEYLTGTLMNGSEQ